MPNDLLTPILPVVEAFRRRAFDHPRPYVTEHGLVIDWGGKVLAKVQGHRKAVTCPFSAIGRVFVHNHPGWCPTYLPSVGDLASMPGWEALSFIVTPIGTCLIEQTDTTLARKQVRGEPMKSSIRNWQVRSVACFREHRGDPSTDAVVSEYAALVGEVASTLGLRVSLVDPRLGVVIVLIDPAPYRGEE